MIPGPKQRISRKSATPAGFTSLLASRVDGGSLGLFRIFFGIAVVLHAWSLLRPRPGGTWVEAYYTGPRAVWNFPYQGFEWLTALPDPWMSLLVYLMALAGILLALGFIPRISSTIVFLAWTYVFLLDKTHYNNHYYLISLIAFLLIWMPTSARFGVSPAKDPTVPFWAIFLLRFQLFVVYFYGGIAKLCQQWLIHAEPVRTALRSPLVQQRLEARLPADMASPVHSLLISQEFAFFMAYSGLLFDLGIGFLLLCRRTRIFALLLVASFHATNHFLLFDDIGWFPLMGFVLTLIFLDPDWPDRVGRGLRERSFSKPNWGWLVGGAVIFPVLGATLGWKLKPSPTSKQTRQPSLAGATKVLLAIWVGLQVLVPLRHHLIRGDVNWTEEHALFSWRMKIAHKEAGLRFHVIDRAILSTQDVGPSEVDWQAWPGPKIFYQQLRARQVEWRALPELLVIFQPMYGERIVFNPWAGQLGQPISAEQARVRVNAVWKKTYGRQPTLYPTGTLAEALNEAASKLEAARAATEVLKLTRQSQALAEKMLSAALNEATLWKLSSELQRRLDKLVENPTHGAAFRLLLSRIHPLGSQGALDTEERFLEVYDKQLIKLSPKKYVILDRDQFGEPWEDSNVVYGDFESIEVTEWQGFQQTMLVRDATGMTHLIWNHHADLRAVQAKLMSVRPIMCFQYTQRIARLWQQIHGHRPEIYLTSQASLVPRPFQSLIDPRIDLANAEINYLGHNNWIVLQGEQDKSVVER